MFLHRRLLRQFEKVLYLDFAFELHHSVQDGVRSRRASWHVDIDRYHLVHPLDHMIGVAERSAANGAASHGNDVFRFGHLVVQTFQHGGHLVHDGAEHEDDIGLTGTVAVHLPAEAGKIGMGAAHTHELNAAAARGEGQRPYRMRPTPVNHVAQPGHDHRSAALAELLDILFEVLVILEIFVAHILDMRPFAHFHFNAPFFHA